MYKRQAYNLGKRMCEKLKELITRQQFDIAIQAAIGAKIFSRETIKAVRKDVTAKCYGGDVSRKMCIRDRDHPVQQRICSAVAGQGAARLFPPLPAHPLEQKPLF